MAADQAQHHTRSRATRPYVQRARQVPGGVGRARAEVLEAPLAVHDRDVDVERPGGQHRQQVRGPVVPARLALRVPRARQLGDGQRGPGFGTKVHGVRDQAAEPVELAAARGVLPERP